MIALRNIRTIASAAVRKAVGVLSVVPVRKAVASLNVATAACVVAALCGVTSCREMPDPADFYFESLKMNEVMVSKETLVLKLKADMAAGSKVVGERKFECWFEQYTEPISVDADENFSADLIPGFFGQNCSVKALFASGSTRLESEPVVFRVLNFEEYVSIVESRIEWITDSSAEYWGRFFFAEGIRPDLSGCLLSEADPDFTAPLTFFSNASGGAVEVELKPLKPRTVYYVKPFFREGENTAYGDVLTFTTDTVLPSVVTSSITDITSESAKCGGSVISDGGSEITAKGVVWSTSQNPTVSLATKTTDGTGTGAFTSTVTGLAPGVTYYVRAYATNAKGTAYGEEVVFSTDLQNDQYVDLGLPSGIKWRPFNLGASSVGEIGDYYAWGATDTFYADGFAQESPTVWKTGFDDGYCWKNTPFNGGATSFDKEYWSLHKSECVDANGVLLPENDAAHVKLGGRWCMPTASDFEELMNYCIITAATFDGTDGLMFQSRISGYKEKWIFIPCSGARSSKFFSNRNDISYWTSSIYPDDNSIAQHYGVLYALIYENMAFINSVFPRNYGMVIRPVYDPGE